MSTKKASSQNDNGSDSAVRITFDVAHLHHAYCFVGERSVIRPVLLNAIAHDLALPMGNSDLLLLDFDSLTIDDARSIRQYAATRPNGKRRAIVISASAITREAQNALLKSFEEPGEGLHFFLIIPSAHILLPTLRSRLSFIDIEETPHATTASAKFIAMSYKERLEWIKDLADDIKEGKRPKQEAIDMLKGVQRESAKKFPVAAHVSIQKHILRALSYANDTSASLKMLLEHVALSIPAK